MKYSVLGFSQQKAVELGLSSEELFVLRWFVTFSGTSKMEKEFVDGQVYYCVNYQAVLDCLWVLNLEKQALRKKIFKNLCESKVLNKLPIRSGETSAYYRYGENYDMLVCNCDEY